MSENFNKDTWWDEIELLKANINKLEQENKELKAEVEALKPYKDNHIDLMNHMAEHDDELILQTFKDAYKAGFDHGLQSDKDEIEKLNGTSDSVGMFDYYFEQHIKGIALIYIHQKSQEKSNEMAT